jgi:hypothetical protein
MLPIPPVLEVLLLTFASAYGLFWTAIVGITLRQRYHRWRSPV